MIDFKTTWGVRISFEWIHCETEVLTVCVCLSPSGVLCLWWGDWILPGAVLPGCCVAASCEFTRTRTHTHTHTHAHTQIHAHRFTQTHAHTHTSSCCLISQQHTSRLHNTFPQGKDKHRWASASIKTYSTLYDFYLATYLNAQVVENSQLVHLKFNYQHTPRCL